MEKLAVISTCLSPVKNYNDESEFKYRSHTVIIKLQNGLEID